jgi:general secretion pathway protein A
VSTAGNASLMSAALMHTLCDHAVGNYRILTTMAAELLAVAAHRDIPQLDEKLYLEVFAPPETVSPTPRVGPALTTHRSPIMRNPSPSAPLSWPRTA